MNIKNASLTAGDLIRGMPATDGAGVKILRSVGARPGLRVDPFLMLDEFSSSDADDYIGGFPPHPHRGFQTLTYMLKGRMEHRDHMDNTGLLEDGGAQWMSYITKRRINMFSKIQSLNICRVL